MRDLQTMWPRAHRTGAIDVRDDPADNGLTVSLRYEIPDCWKAEGKLLSFQIHDLLVAGALGALKSADRKGDILLGAPRKLSHRVTLRMPRKWGGEGWNHGAEAEGLSFFNRLRIEGRTLINERAVTVSSWSIPAVGASDYVRVVEAMHTNVLSIMARKRFGRIVSAASGGFGLNFGTAWLVWIGIMVLATILKAVVPK